MSGEMEEFIHPFWVGFYDREKGATEYDCPFPEGTKSRSAWMHGWETADASMAPQTPEEEGYRP